MSQNTGTNVYVELRMRSIDGNYKNVNFKIQKRYAMTRIILHINV